MTEQRARAVNIGPKEQRRRLVMGVAMIVVGLAIAGGLILGGASRPWRFVLFVPFWIGALGLFQAREKT